jgi:hypothetical protein
MARFLALCIGVLLAGLMWASLDNPPQPPSDECCCEYREFAPLTLPQARALRAVAKIGYH